MVDNLQLLLKYFPDLLAIFKAYASRGTISDVFNIQWKNFSELANDVKVCCVA